MLTAITVALALAEGEEFQAPPAGPLEVTDVERHAGRPLSAMQGHGDVADAVRAAGPGARGIVLVRARGQDHDHAVSVVHDEGRVVLVDGQARQLAVLPADPAMVRLVLTAIDARPPRRLIRWHSAAALRLGPSRAEILP